MKFNVNYSLKREKNNKKITRIIMIKKNLFYHVGVKKAFGF